MKKDGLVGLKIVNYFSLILAIALFFSSFHFILIVKLVMFGALILTSSILYFKRKSYLSDYENFREDTIKGLIVVGVLVFLTIYKVDYARQMNALAPFILVYIVSCVTILRIQRQRERTSENELMSRLNYVYSGFLILLAFLFGSESSRAFFAKGIVELWNSVPEYVLLTLSWLYFAIMSILSKPFEFLVYLINLFRSLGLKLDRDEPVNIFKLFVDEGSYEALFGVILKSNFVKIIIWGAIISLVIYFLLKIFSGSSEKRNRSKDFEEEKEFFIGNSGGQVGLLKKFSELMRSKSNNELIRLYYSKILKLCLKKQINIGNEDTSQDVSEKSGFDATQMAGIRETYIKIRYSSYQASKKDLKDFVKNYKIIVRE